MDEEQEQDHENQHPFQHQQSLDLLPDIGFFKKIK